MVFPRLAAQTTTNSTTARQQQSQQHLTVPAKPAVMGRPVGSRGETAEPDAAEDSDAAGTAEGGGAESGGQETGGVGQESPPPSTTRSANAFSALSMGSDLELELRGSQGG